jgi:hypothetical protein
MLKNGCEGGGTVKIWRKLIGNLEKSYREKIATREQFEKIQHLKLADVKFCKKT